jgi:hypothetical protein
MNTPEVIGRAHLNGAGDLMFDGEIKPYVYTDVEVIRVCKSGLYQIKTHDGTLLSVPKRNLTPL